MRHVAACFILFDPEDWKRGSNRFANREKRSRDNGVRATHFTNYVELESSLLLTLSFIMFLNTASACGGVKGGVINRRNGIRENFT